MRPAHGSRIFTLALTNTRASATFRALTELEPAFAIQSTPSGGLDAQDPCRWFVRVLRACWSSPRRAGPGQHCRLRQGPERRRAARRHRRSVERRADRKERAPRSPTAPATTASSICRRAPTAWRSRCPASRRCAAKASCIQGTFAAPVSAELQVGALEETITVTGTPDRGRQQQHRAVRRRSRHPRRDPDADPQHAVARAAAARHHGHAVRARPVQHERARLVDRRHGDRHRRHARQQPVRQRPVQRLLHERRGDRRGHVHDRRRVRRNAERRPAHQQHAEGRRQHASPARSSPTAPAAACRPTTAPTR